MVKNLTLNMGVNNFHFPEQLIVFPAPGNTRHSSATVL